MRKTRWIWSVPVIFLLIGMTAPGHGQGTMPVGSIQGRLVDAETKTPLIGANVIIYGTTLGAATDVDGAYFIPNVPVGNYSLEFRYIGYGTLKRADVIVRSERRTFVNAELHPAAVEMEEVVVSAGYFSDVTDQAVSAINFSSEEIRRAPGSAGDVSRIVMTLPGLAKVNDQSNNLIVRGGSPMENTFYIDNIEIPNINHFPNQGASGGPIGILNVDFIQDVTFVTGGFPAIYGDKLSSIMDITFREGNTDEFDGQLDLNFAGFGGTFEGPAFGKKGSWLLSLRRSYLDFVVKAFDAGSTIAPRYGDIQGKVVYPLNKNHKLSLLGIFADDHNAPDRDVAIENYMTHFGRQNLYQGTIGLNWRALWSGIGYSNTSLAFMSNVYHEDFYETTTGIFDIKNHSREQSLNFRNVNCLKIGKVMNLDFGLEMKQIREHYDNWYAGATNAVGEFAPALNFQRTITASRVGAFLSVTANPGLRFSLTAGGRWDYFSYNRQSRWSPRLALAYRITAATSLHGSLGLYYQNLPLLLLAQQPEFKSLRTPRARHAIAGVSHLLTENTKLILEVYHKAYSHFPIDTDAPSLFIVDESFFNSYTRLVDTGEAASYGLEVTAQKKLAADFYGLMCASYFRSRYKGSDSVWRNRNYDNRWTFSVEGGYKPDVKWEFSLRWIYAGGVPYTPLDIEKSKYYHRATLDAVRVNELRYPDYHAMNVRCDRRFHFNHSNLIVYVSVWNVYDRRNISNYVWSEEEQRAVAVYQWRVLPLFGLEYEF
ncbi:MAG: TonB-dependent receptor [Candidatus Zhuqueibacterota bacterium]